MECRYAQTFDSKLGNMGKLARMALGAFVIKERYGFSDEDTVQKIRMNPYLQFFLGLPVFQHEAPFDASTMTLFRKRIPADLLADLNDFITGRRTLMRMSGPKLGRSPKDKALHRQQLLEKRLEFGERSAIESAFGVGKRRYSLNLVIERLQETSEETIHVSILTMNLWKYL